MIRPRPSEPDRRFGFPHFGGYMVSELVEVKNPANELHDLDLHVSSFNVSVQTFKIISLYVW